MIKNYLVTAFRSMWKNKVFSLINILGLTMGITASLLILLFVRDERTYDTYHKDSGNIYRIVKDFINDDGSRIPDATTPAALMPAMLEEVPDVEAITRLRPNWGGTFLLKYKDKAFTEERLYGVDTGFFDVFTFRFIRGNARTAFEQVNSIVLTKSSALRYFGDEDPIGKVIKTDFLGDLAVTAITEDVPSNSHFHFDFLVSFQKRPGLPSLENDWNGYNDYTYVKVKPGTNINELEKKIQQINDRNVERSFSDFYVQPITDIHLHSNLKWELEANGNYQHVNIFSLIALIVIVIAAINYINLTTAKASVRAREIGVRKVIGAARASLMYQFLLETVLFCLIAASLALILAYLLVPVLNGLSDKHLQLGREPLLILYVIISAVVLGLLSGLVPALYLSSFNPVAVLKGLRLKETRALSLRKSLVIVQFTLSIILIAGAIIITKQLRYLSSANLGMNTDQVAVIQNVGVLNPSDQRSFIAELKRIRGVKETGGANGMLPNRFNTSRMSVKGSEEEQQINFIGVDFDFLNVMDIRIKEGRGFSSKLQSDTLGQGIAGGPAEQNIGSIILNETAVKDLRVPPPVIGKQLLFDGDDKTSYYVTIVGVTNDFHFTSLRTRIKPFGFVLRADATNNVFVKLDPQQVPGTLAQVENLWKRYPTEREFSYSFLDETFSRLYGAERRFQKVFTILVALGILIASLGLLGLVTFAAQQRVKEIGIRKVLGATVSNVVQLLLKDFLRLIFFAFIIALPVSWYAANRWLEDFAYRVNVSWWVFPLAGVIALLIALFTISFQSIKAALANPVKNLRTE